EKMQELFSTNFNVNYNEKKQYYTAQTSSKVVAEILLKMGLKRGRKFDSFDLSNELFSCEEKNIAAYIQGLFDAEGSVCPKIRAVNLTLYNKKALEKVFHALLRCGIFSSIQKTGDGQNRLMICGKRSLLQFVKTISFSAPEKNQAVISMAESIKKEYSPTEIIPNISNKVIECLKENKIALKTLPSACKTAVKTANASKHAIRQALTACASTQQTQLQLLLNKFVESEVNWLSVLEVETVENKEDFVYDLEVEKHHNFVANGIIAHNSYATLFSQITTGKPSKVKSSTGSGKYYECEISIDVKKNQPAIKNVVEKSGKYRGLRIEAEFSEVEYKRGTHSVYEYLRRSALANPHAQITLVDPNKEITVFPRATTTIPKKPKSVLPHPLGITTSDLIDIAHATGARKIGSTLETEFCRVSKDKVKELQALVPNTDFNKAPKSLQWPEAEAIVKSFDKVKWIAPDLDTMSPIGQKQTEKSLKNLLEPEQMKVVERKARVFRGGIPFMVEAAIAYGGKSGAAQGGNKGELLRYANRTPLLFDAGTCAITEAVKTIDWARYDLKEWESMPLTIFVNFTSVYVPYTGAGKLSISAEEELVGEIRFALMESARSVSTYLHSLQRAKDQEHRRTIFYRYIGEVSEALHDITGKEKSALEEKLKKIAQENTRIMEANDKKNGDQE
ncbi:MAG: DNA topoisomerase VI subunit B, partial [Candidatus Micrarchaeia archaeon]